MTILGPRLVPENVVEYAEPVPRWRRFVPRSRRGKATVAAAMAGVLVAGLLGAAYETSPGGSLWGVTRTVFPGHAQDVALTAVVADLKKAQDILGSGEQPTADQLTDARTALNQAKQALDYLSPSPERTSLQNLYLQLTQQLLQYTPDSVLRLAPLPAPPPEPPAAVPADPADPQQDAVALTSASAPTWGYDASDDYVPAPPGVPDSPMADWPQPIDPPSTPNLGNLGYYDQSWGQLYGYNPGGWYNYDLGGYNQYGYDFTGYDRWGYDRWGYDRWGYDRWGYNWAGYNWAGYDRHGWDRNGRNEWGQHRDRPRDPRNQRWYDHHHPYQQYYEWKFRIYNPVYRRAQWDRAHGFNPHRYQNWNMNRDWHHPRNRDWAPPAIRVNTTVNIHVSAPVVNLNASLTQFISNDKATRTSGHLMKDLADKSPRNFARDLTPRTNSFVGWQLPSGLGQRSDTPKENHRSSSEPPESTTPPALAAPAPAAPPSKVSPTFTAPKLSPVPAYTPPTVDKPREKPETAPAPEKDLDLSPELPATPPRADRPNPADATSPGDQPEPASPPNPALDRPHEIPGPRQTAPEPQAPASEAPAAPPESPRQQERPQQRNAPEEPPVQRDPAPKVQVPEPEAPAPKTQAPVREEPVWQEPAPAPAPEREAPKEAPAPRYQAPERQAPVWQEPAQQAPPQEAPARQRPAREAPARQEPPAREAPAPRQAPQQRSEQPRSEPSSPKGPKCPPPMCSGRG
ncbi:FIVAR domain-containing protein [Mycolicibacterium peregrinum]|uniref:Uncharacterized protein n=1 Tax=Mycolicibacterium peregrinum TaxID=43304 RepID=A0A4Z0HIQ0_MYCPR|nr:FIVAR domain-containing protein [Mycolicibacterium peregrinum]TGB36483.1 hypothetical protein EJD98_29565 [Mycolicibacterium peregrinum]TGB37015.1 hypothetical protein EJD94_27495 [Mycolicibacterium peregrinum]